MAYGFQLKRVSDNFVFDSALNFYSTTRNGFSTSDTLYFESINFQSTLIKLSFGNDANLLPLSNIYLPTMDFDLNSNNFYSIARNYSKPTIVKICDIAGYETGIGTTVYSSSNFILGAQIIKNYNDPSHLYTVSNYVPIQTILNPNMSLGINSNYIQGDNFAYVRYINSNYYKYFLLTYSNSVFSWTEIPNENFYVNCNFYLTNNNSAFNGTKIKLSAFNGIPLSQGQTILINNYKYNDVLSGLYTIINISDSVYLQQTQLLFNFSGQTFTATTNLDISSLNQNISVCYYVPYTYGNTAEVFSKNLLLQKFTNLYIGLSSNYMPILTYENNNLVSQSTFLINLNQNINLSKLSDQFQLGMFASSWCQDCLLFGATLNIEVDGGS